jgi:hypothetical protein
MRISRAWNLNQGILKDKILIIYPLKLKQFSIFRRFLEIPKTTISFVMSFVRPFFCLSAWNNGAPTGRSFDEIRYVRIFRKSRYEIQL